MKVQRFEIGSYMTNCYVLADDEGSMIIDAGEGIEPVIEFCRKNQLVPQMLVITHGHADHICGSAAVKEAFPEIEIAAGRRDASLLSSPLRNLSPLMGKWVKGPKADRLLDEDDLVEVGGMKLRVLDTPGHTKGAISLYSDEGPNGRPVVFTGDALFAGSIGRTDFPGASRRTLLKSIKTKLLQLPDETEVYPGHGPPTTIGAEKAENPFLT
ncbi:MAG: MBL fold metallo-hydrolase [Planctomycetia bacterium]|nr:MBL fold metallo-hydrolase [Planctomycetia bacterium]